MGKKRGQFTSSELLGFRKMFNTGLAFQKGFSSTDPKGGTMALLQGVSPQATDEDILSLKTKQKLKTQAGGAEQCRTCIQSLEAVRPVLQKLRAQCLFWRASNREHLVSSI